MGRRGPPKKPTELKILQGNPGEKKIILPPKTDLPLNTEPPIKLKGIAREYWDDILIIVTNMRVMTQADRAALCRYCKKWGEWVAAEQELDREGRTYSYVTREGYTKHAAHPKVSQVDTLMNQLIKLEQEFGLTPAARASLAVAPPNTEEDSAKKFLFG